MKGIKILLVGVLLVAGICSGCAPVMIEKTYSESYTDPQTGKTITYTEKVQQVPDSKLPMHIKHTELYD